MMLWTTYNLLLESAQIKNAILFQPACSHWELEFLATDSVRQKYLNDVWFSCSKVYMNLCCRHLEFLYLAPVMLMLVTSLLIILTRKPK